MLAIAGQTAEPNGLTFYIMEPMGARFYFKTLLLDLFLTPPLTVPFVI